MDETKKAVLAALGADEDMDYEDVCEKLKAVFHKEDGKKGPLDSPAPGTEIVERCLQARLPDALGAVIKPLMAKIESMETAMNATRQQAEATERDTIIGEASRMGKKIPLSADSLKLVSIPVLKELVAGLPKETIPTKPLVKPLNAADGKPIKRTISDASAAIEAQIAGNRN